MHKDYEKPEASFNLLSEADIMSASEAVISDTQSDELFGGGNAI